MERTKGTVKQRPIGSRLTALTELIGTIVGRARFANSMGKQSYGGNRDLTQALGYAMDITYNDYLDRYERQEIAKAIIDRPVRATWQGELELIEADAKDTALEEAWRDLDRNLGVRTQLARLDRLTCLGRYGVLLLGLSDVRAKEDFEKPVSALNGNKLKLLYVKPFGEGTAVIDTYIDNPQDVRYGKPKTYNINVVNVTDNSSQVIKVHYSRVVHVVYDTLESDVYGIPVLESVFNRLMDLEKIVGGDAEMFWRGARPGYAGQVNPDFQMTDTAMADLKAQIDEYENNLRRILVNEGLTLESLAQQISDPKSHVDVQLQMVCAALGMPKRILTGSERGELSSTQDQGEWVAWVQSRRDEHAEPNILRPFVDRLIELRILPEPKLYYDVRWQDLYALSEKDRVDIGKARAQALAFYMQNIATIGVMPPEAFFEYCMGLTRDQIQLVSKFVEDNSASEDKVMEFVEAIEQSKQPAQPAATQTTTVE